MVADTTESTRLTHLGHRPASRRTVTEVAPTSSRDLVLAVTMPCPELGGGNATSSGTGTCLRPALKRQHPALEHAIRAEPAPNSFPDRIGDAVVLAVFAVVLHEFHDRG